LLPALSAIALLIGFAISPAAAQPAPPSGFADSAATTPSSSFTDSAGTTPSSGFTDSVSTPPPAVPPAAAIDSTATEEISRLVGRISVEGNTFTDSMRIIRTFDVPPGAHFSADAVRRGIRKLFALGLFEDAWVQSTPRGDQMDLVIHVLERPRIGKIEFTGNRKRDKDDLEKKLFLRPGEAYSPTTVQTQIDSLIKFYHEEGFAQAKVTAALDTTATDRRIGLRFVIDEGEKVKIRDIEFVGSTLIDAKKVRKQMKSKQKGFFGGGEVNEEFFTEDIEKIQDYYQNHGFRDARVTGRELVPHKDDPKKLTLRYTIEEGPRYWFGNTSWDGNTVVHTITLQRFVTWRPGDLYDKSKITKARGGAFGEYAEQGYLYLDIDARETVRDSAVDLAFGVTEGRPSHIRYVHITGNRNTREKVIRREIAIHEGDRFQRSTLVRTQGDVFRLSLFEDVQIDFAPAESTDVDITLKLKEKSVGTASAGAGYTAESGVTGFLELGHNNVLGNGQSLQLHLERGAKREDYFLSFTEPWFRDTPTLLGFSVFNTNNQRDLYDEKRRGGSARIGRPLPWPDYSRGSLTYQLEDVTIDQIGDVLTPADSVALIGVPVGQANRTSSVEAVFSRISTDNPFYPRKGSRLTLDFEVAGGPFGGKINFHKQRIEGRVYLPSIAKRVTTMLRARFGLLGEYPDQIHSDVPPYERFRLGGGTTTDPLRGYDDYSVVPPKFIHQVAIGYDTLRVGPDSGQAVPILSTVRYPGGRYMSVYTVEQQFPIVHPLHGVVFFDAGNTWDLWHEIRPLDLKMGAGIGFRLEIPLLGNIGFDYGYGFNRDDGPKAVGHFLIGQTFF
jgi:outer membrane protein insertion porin family